MSASAVFFLEFSQPQGLYTYIIHQVNYKVDVN